MQNNFMILMNKENVFNGKYFNDKGTRQLSVNQLNSSKRN